MGILSGDDDDDSATKLEMGGFSEGEQLRSGPAKRVVDEEAGVVIYALKAANSNGVGYGLTAIPISETDLEVDSE